MSKPDSITVAKSLTQDSYLFAPELDICLLKAQQAQAEALIAIAESLAQLASQDKEENK